MNMMAEDSKVKRIAESPVSIDRDSKKAKIEDAARNEEVFVKVLIPMVAAGAIIGKGGETMRKLQDETGCRVKMSKSSDTYPGTNERIAIVHGPVSSAMVAIKHFMGKVRQNESSLDYEERVREVKLVVPNTSAAMIIGKSGATIKEIREKSGAAIQIIPKAGSPEAQRSVERVVTLSAGNQSKLEQAVELALAKIASDPQHNAYPNYSYGEANPGSGMGPIHGDRDARSYIT